MAKKSKNWYFKWIGICILLIIGLQVFQSNSQWVEHLYSRGFYPIYAYLPKLLFGWLPFSIGDILYAVIFVGLGYILIKSFILLFKKQFRESGIQVLRFIGLLLTVYIFFYTAWAMNYFRIPISKQMELKVDTILLEDHLTVLDEHIQKANTLREGLIFTDKNRSEADDRIEKLMKSDSLFQMLSKTQVKIKTPIIGSMASYFGVSGYFNPFSNEAHVNGQMPLTSYPFTVAHELSHQMGIGFEDECNFIAFVKLKENEDPWFQYSAYYESTTYLLRTLYLVDSTAFETYKAKLSPKVIMDIKTDQEYWKRYTGWLADASGLFYNQYLKHNNQAEGMARYGMVSRLIIAWEQKNRQPR
ncbi:DUF3810 domain-containing protein [Sphingobacterium daejeonense]|uniref:DUF3810 domain-containing protein n=1 Tax=Sphingobacterium daejeonense TaxID=371142 RepID=A0ABW3RNP9_9SPHI